MATTYDIADDEPAAGVTFTEAALSTSTEILVNGVLLDAHSSTVAQYKSEKA